MQMQLRRKFNFMICVWIFAVFGLISTQDDQTFVTTAVDNSTMNETTTEPEILSENTTTTSTPATTTATTTTLSSPSTTSIENAPMTPITLTREPPAVTSQSADVTNADVGEDSDSDGLASYVIIVIAVGGGVLVVLVVVAVCCCCKRTSTTNSNKTDAAQTQDDQEVVYARIDVNKLVRRDNKQEADATANTDDNTANTQPEVVYADLDFVRNSAS